MTDKKQEEVKERPLPLGASMDIGDEPGQKPVLKEDEVEEEEEHDDDESHADELEAAYGGGGADEDEERLGKTEGDADGEVIENESDEQRRQRNRESRERRKQKRKEAALADKRLIESLSAQLQEANERLGKVEGRFVQSDSAQLDAAIQAQRNAYQTASQELSRAIANRDQPGIQAAMEARDNARDRFNRLTFQKEQRTQAFAQGGQTQQPTIKPEVMNNAKRFMERNKWYDPSGKDTDSRIAMVIDQELIDSGYNPTTPSYWAELERRCRERLPHRYKQDGGGNNGGSRLKGKPGQMGASNAPKGRVQDREGVTLSASRKQALLDRGLKPGTPEWKKRVAAYAAWDKANPRGSKS